MCVFFSTTAVLNRLLLQLLWFFEIKKQNSLHVKCHLYIPNHYILTLGFIKVLLHHHQNTTPHTHPFFCLDSIIFLQKIKLKNMYTLYKSEKMPQASKIYSFFQFFQIIRQAHFNREIERERNWTKKKKNRRNRAQLNVAAKLAQWRVGRRCWWWCRQSRFQSRRWINEGTGGGDLNKMMIYLLYYSQPI